MPSWHECVWTYNKLLLTLESRASLGDQLASIGCGEWSSPALRLLGLSRWVACFSPLGLYPTVNSSQNSSPDVMKGKSSRLVKCSIRSPDNDRLTMSEISASLRLKGTPSILVDPGRYVACIINQIKVELVYPIYVDDGSFEWLQELVYNKCAQ